MQKWARQTSAAVLVGLGVYLLGVCLLGAYPQTYVTVVYHDTPAELLHHLARVDQAIIPIARLEVHAISTLLAFATGSIFGVLQAVPRWIIYLRLLIP